MTENQDQNRQDVIFFGVWEFNPALNQLESSKQTIRLEPKTADLLKLFLSRSNQVLSREALLSDLWPDVIVSDDSLTQLVIKLRKALGDDTRKPQYIQTIPKRGYRFLAENRNEGATQDSNPNWLSWRRLASLCAFFILLAVTVWFMSAQRVAQKSTQTTEPQRSQYSSERLSVMVMPLLAVREGEKQSLFASRLSNAVSLRLSKLEHLWVIRPEALLKEAESVNQASQSGANYLVTGSAQQNSNSLIADIELIDTATGRLLWSEHYQQKLTMDDAVLLLSDQISEGLETSLIAEDSRRERQAYTRDDKAYSLFMQGQNHLLARRKEQNLLARALYQEAIERDPMFARAYAGLALSHAADYRNQWSENLPNSLKRAKELAETALGIQSDIPHLHWVMAYVSAQDRRHDLAIEHLDHALNLDPNYADAHALLGGIKTYIGRPKETIELIRKAMRLNPSAGSLYFLLLGRAYFFIGDTEQAIINLKESLSRNPSILEAHVYMAAAQVQLGDIESAQWEAAEIEALKADFSAINWLLTYPMSDPDQKNLLLTLLNRVSL